MHKKSSILDIYFVLKRKKNVKIKNEKNCAHK